MNGPAADSGAPDRINAEIIRRRLAGETYAVIAEALGISEGALDRRLKKLRALGCPAVAPVRSGGCSSGRRWPTKRKAALRTLWDEGHSAAEIGRRLGVTKNAVIGEAHRNGLSGRPSPIRRTGPRAGEAARRAQAATIPPLASLAPTETGAGGVVPPPFRAARSAPALVPGTPPPRAPQAAPAPPEAVPPPRYGRVEQCSWPLDHPTRPGRFLACDAPTMPGRPYCGAHCAAAYRPRWMAAA